MRQHRVALGLATALMVASGLQTPAALALPAVPQLPQVPAPAAPAGVPQLPAPGVPVPEVGAIQEQLNQLTMSPNRIITGYGLEAAPVDVNALRDPSVREHAEVNETVQPGNLVAFGDSVFANPTAGDITAAGVAAGAAKKDPNALGVARAAGVNTSVHGCAQGQKRLPKAIAEKLGVPLNDYSCPGATVYTPKTIKPPVNHQVDLAIADGALNASTKYVILQGGFNDIYQNYTRPTGEFPNDDKLVALTKLESQRDLYARSLDSMLTKIRQHAPNARISLVGYHTITEGSKSGWQCLYHIGHGQGKENVWDATAQFPVYWDTEGERNINKWMREAADRNHVNFIDLRSKTSGHGECAAPEDRWVAGILIDQTTSDYNLALHLTDEGIDSLAPMVATEM